MFWKKNKNKENAETSNVPKYKAIYKSLYSGKIEELTVSSPTSALTTFLIAGDIWEMYILTHVIPLNESQEV